MHCIIYALLYNNRYGDKLLHIYIKELSTDVSKQNAKIVATALAEDNRFRIESDDIMDIPMLMGIGLLKDLLYHLGDILDLKFI